MGKFDRILICTDLDGTLFKNDKSISEENLEAIEYFKREGGSFSFITGRMPFFIDGALKAVRPNAPIGCINGGAIYDTERGEYLWRKELDKSAFRLVEFADRAIGGLGIQVNAFDKIYFCRENECMRWFREVTSMPNLVSSLSEIDEPVAKIVFGDFDTEKLDRLAALLRTHPIADDFDYIRSEKNLYEILPKGASKGRLVERLADTLGIPRSRTVALGDYNNDIDMLKRAAVGIAVANATPEVKAAADRVTVSNEEHALAVTVEEIEKGVISFRE